MVEVTLRGDMADVKQMLVWLVVGDQEEQKDDGDGGCVADCVGGQTVDAEVDLGESGEPLCRVMGWSKP